MSLADVLKTFVDEKEIVKDETTGKWTEKDAAGISLKGVVQRGRLKLKKETRPSRMGVSFAPSQITYRYCRRAKVGQLAGQLDLHYDVATPSLQNVFDMGHAIHDLWQSHAWKIGILYGDWYCIKCDQVYRDLLAPSKCPSGKKTHGRNCLEFRELQVHSEKYHIKGRCDGLIYPTGKLEGMPTVWDIKSIANRLPNMSEQAYCFEDLEERGPKPEHVVQLMLYIWIYELANGHLFYVSKNDHKVKSYAIKYDYEIIRPYLEEIEGLLQLAEQVKRGEKVELPVPCGKEACACEQVLVGPSARRDQPIESGPESAEADRVEVTVEQPGVA